MKYEVKRFFKLKPSNKRYHAGDIFETKNGALAEQLRSDGFLGKRIPEPSGGALPVEKAAKEEGLPAEEVPEENLPADVGGEEPPADIEEEVSEPDQEEQQVKQPDVLDLGGGWYQLPDGRKVRKSQLDSEFQG